jgi:pyruvate/2-oxoglutarate dehydrogenase complex dihydrolipoamide dehydrogenase (E3) component
MSQAEQFEVLILGSGQGGKLLAWHMARSGRRTAVVERRWIGGSCPNIACLPSKNEIWSARVAHLVHHAAQFGTATGPVATDMAKVRQRKRDMVNREIDFHLQQYQTTGAELIMGTGRFVAPKTLEVRLNDGGTRERWRATRFSSTSERTRQFRAFLVSKPPDPSHILRLWSSTTYRHI